MSNWIESNKLQTSTRDRVKSKNLKSHKVENTKVASHDFNR